MPTPVIAVSSKNPSLGISRTNSPVLQVKTLSPILNSRLSVTSVPTVSLRLFYPTINISKDVSVSTSSLASPIGLLLALTYPS